MNILVVEDEPDLAEMLGRALEQFGNSCLFAHSADRAEELLGKHSIDAVTLDLVMPGRAALDWLEALAATRPDLARRTLVITGRQLDTEIVERLTRCGAGILAKPFTLDSLQAAVKSQIAWTPPSRQN
jgi:two-component system OmpR family response regulator